MSYFGDYKQLYKAKGDCVLQSWYKHRPKHHIDEVLVHDGELPSAEGVVVFIKGKLDNQIRDEYEVHKVNKQRAKVNSNERDPLWNVIPVLRSLMQWEVVFQDVDWDKDYDRENKQEQTDYYFPRHPVSFVIGQILPVNVRGLRGLL
jgi:hypothetical protein